MRFPGRKAPKPPPLTDVVEDSVSGTDLPVSSESNSNRSSDDAAGDLTPNRSGTRKRGSRMQSFAHMQNLQDETRYGAVRSSTRIFSMVLLTHFRWSITYTARCPPAAGLHLLMHSTMESFYGKLADYTFANLRMYHLYFCLQSKNSMSRWLLLCRPEQRQLYSRASLPIRQKL